jgi:formylglycine-generating enzyme required for sulfatase activity
MVFVQAGKFWRGSCNESTTPSCQAGSPGYVLSSSPDSMASYETPIRQIYLDAYYIDTFEVSVKHFEMCVNAGACNDSNFKTKSYDSYCNYGYSDRGNHPMNCLNWDGANEYCEFVGKRLPTEAEWEKAARGENGRKYPWGDQNPDCTYANFYYNANHCVGTTSPVGSYPKGKSAYGLYDMAGNVWEWVYDWWAADYYNKDFSSPDYSPDINPQGPSNGTNRGIRGGGWRSDVISWFRSANRSMFSNPSSFGSTVGFRCAAGQ